MGIQKNGDKYERNEKGRMKARRKASRLKEKQNSKDMKRSESEPREM